MSNYKQLITVVITLSIMATLVAPLAVAAATPSAFWDFDELSGPYAFDQSGNGNNGTLENGATRFMGTVNGNKLLLDGDDDYILVQSGPSLNEQSEVSISASVWPEKLGAALLFKGDGIPARYQFGIRPDNSLFFRAGRTGSPGGWQSEGTVPLNAWSHIAVTYDFGNVANRPTFYINGEAMEAIEVQAPSGSPVSDDGVLYIGNNPDETSGFEGRVDNLQIFDEILTKAEIVAVRTEHGGGASQEKPNVIVVMVDDQEDGSTLDVMNALEEHVTDEGTRFVNSFVDNSLCCPSRAAFLTGQYSHNNDIFLIAPSTLFNGKTYKGGYVTLHERQQHLLPVWLQDADYTTAMFGKYPNGYGSQVSGDVIPAGWDKWFTWIDGPGLKYFNYDINDDGTRRHFGNDEEDYFTDVIAEEAVEFIDTHANSKDPFFMYFNPVAPHTEVEIVEDIRSSDPLPAPRHVGRYAGAKAPRPPSFNESDVSDKPTFMNSTSNQTLSVSQIATLDKQYQARLESLLAVDEAIEAMVEALERTGELDNTVIIYTSDNGFFHGEHRLEQGKRLVYEESIRVPLMMRGPGFKKGTERNELVNNIDVTATILDLADANPTRGIDGRSLLPLLEGKKPTWRSTLLMQAASKFEERPVSDETFYSFYKAVHTKNYVYVEHEMPGGTIEKEFYDLKRDPYQLSNKANDQSYASVITELKKRLNDMSDCEGSSCWLTKAEPSTSSFGTNTDDSDGGATSGGNNQTSGPTLVLTPTAGAAQNCPTLSRNLYLGERGADVSDLQSFLTQTGDYTYDELTAYYGPATAAAVQKYQCREMSICSGSPESNGYGVVGQMTRNSIASKCSSSTLSVPSATEVAAIMSSDNRSAKLTLIQRLINVVTVLRARLSAMRQ